jgi:hypothetical protein
MWFCKKEYSVCVECEVHFETRLPLSNSDEEQFEQKFHLHEFCLEHRRPRAALERRRQKVVDWAYRNWAKLEAEVLKEEETERDIDRALQRAQDKKDLYELAGYQQQT